MILLSTIIMDRTYITAPTSNTRLLLGFCCRAKRVRFKFFILST